MAKVANGSSGGGSSTKPPSSSGDGRLSFNAIVFMSLLALQFGIQPIVTQRFTSKTIIKSTVIFMQEVVKLIIGAVGISLGKTSWGDVTAGWTIASWIRLALLPATIYLVQNMCSLFAYQNLDAVTYNVLNQTKTLSAALCCYLLMKKKQSPMQMLALILLLAAALVMEGVLPLDGGALLPSSASASLSPRHFSHGVLPILAASFLSGLAGAITQRSLQAGDGRDALLFTVELCVASLLLLSASLAASDDGESVRRRGFFDGWDALTLVPILTNSAGGVLVGLVIKHAGTVRKGFALIFGILISGIVQSLLDEGRTLSREEVAGGVLAAASLWMHAANPLVGKRTGGEAARVPEGGATATPKTVASDGTSRTARRGGRKSRKED